MTLSPTFETENGIGTISSVQVLCSRKKRTLQSKAAFWLSPVSDSVFGQQRALVDPGQVSHPPPPPRTTTLHPPEAGLLSFHLQNLGSDTGYMTHGRVSAVLPVHAVFTRF